MADCAGSLLAGRVFLYGYHPAQVRRPRVVTMVAKSVHKTGTHAMLTDLQRKAVVQHILNLAGIAEDLSTRSEKLTEQIDDLAQALNIQTEFVPFDEGFPDPSLTEGEDRNV
uniref:Uncharacterized protein n=1 Tax=Candidatus Kentrum sp. TC TaxID=2126339 RepID=A0A450YJV2_9GAMM|nr:MAG: hypothetical protein BECKTC1821D_GA0114238_100663 [Candidatus Kentron sp. TC]VFK41812.1 MAG: hypothetical protein BECKTC1821E_GA0114239_101448 [Candidatus Kentron sp. TC]